MLYHHVQCILMWLDHITLKQKTQPTNHYTDLCLTTTMSMPLLSTNIHQIETSDNEVVEKIERFLFVVTPDDEERDDINTWEGSITQMRKINEKRIS